MRHFFSTAFLVVIATSIAAAQYEPPAQGPWRQISPDKSFMAATRIIPDDIYIWNTDQDGGRLMVIAMTATGKSESYVSYDLPRLVAQCSWSPDSRYLVLTTVSAGGHSPWHFNSYVYSVADKSLRYMDDVVGLVGAADFKFVDPHTVSMKVVGPDMDTDNPKPHDIDLDQAVKKMKAVGGKKEGKMQ